MIFPNSALPAIPEVDRFCVFHFEHFLSWNKISILHDVVSRIACVLPDLLCFSHLKPPPLLSICLCLFLSWGRGMEGSSIASKQMNGAPLTDHRHISRSPFIKNESPRPHFRTADAGVQEQGPWICTSQTVQAMLRHSKLWSLLDCSFAEINGFFYRQQARLVWRFYTVLTPFQSSPGG